MCGSHCSSSRTKVSLRAPNRTISILKLAFEFLLTTDDEVESLPEHGGVDDQGHRQGGIKFRVACHHDFLDNISPETA